MITFARIIRPVGGGIALLMTKRGGILLAGYFGGKWQISNSGFWGV